MHTHHNALAAALRGHLSPVLRLLDSAGSAHALLQAAQEEGVRPLLVDILLNSDAHTLAAPLRQTLTDRAMEEAALAVHQQRELRRVLGLLCRAGVPCVVFKGAATAFGLYSRPELRPRDDADLLVDPSHADAVTEVLEDAGYARVPSNDRLHAMAQVLFRRRDLRGVLHNLDVHWRISNRPTAPGDEPFAPRALRARAVPLPALGDGALQPDPVDSVIIACTHLAAHHAGALRLVWLYEIRLMLERLDDDARVALAARVRAWNLARAFAAGLRASVEIFDAPIRGLEPLLREGADLTRGRTRLHEWLADLGALPHTPARLRYLAAHAFPAEAFMRARPGDATRPLAWLYLRRALRGLRHLLRH